MDQSTDHSKMNFSQISEEIFIGTNYCCKAHFTEELVNKGIRADISLEAESLDQPWGVKYFLWLPTVDHTAPTMEALVLGVQMLSVMVQRKQKVFVHCKNGHGRAPTLVAAYLISTGMSLNQAIRTIAKKRPEIHIEPVQLATLEKFEKEVHW